MMDGMNNMIGPFYGWVLLSLLVLIVLGLAAAWLFQQIQCGAGDSSADRGGHSYPPASGN